MERDSLYSCNVATFFHFNSHAHVERDKLCAYLVKLVADFNSHAHVERDNVAVTFAKPLDISTHTLTWSVTLCNGEVIVPLRISTHTLTWSVTLDVVYIWCLLNVMRTYFFI